MVEYKQRPYLFVAIKTGYIPCVQALLDAGADLMAVENSGKTNENDKVIFSNAHGCAVIYHRADVLKHLIKLCPKGIHVPFKYDRRTDTQVMMAICNRNNGDCVRALIEAGVNPNVKDSHGMTLLHIAVRNEDNSLIEYLLSRPGIDKMARLVLGPGLAVTALDLCK